MHMKRGISLLLVLVLMVGLFAACSSGGSGDTGTTGGQDGGSQDGGTAAPGEKGFGGTMNVGTFADPDTLNPIYGNDMAGSWILSLLYPTLLKMDQDGNKIPWVIEEPVWAEDGMSVSIQLKEGFTWDDGVPFTTKDIDYTYRTIYETQAQWQYIALEGISWTIEDDNNMTFHLDGPAPYFLDTIGFWQQIVPAHIWEEVSYEEIKTFPNANPVGLGPFKLTAYERGQYYTLEARDFPLAEAGRPYLDAINFRVYADTNTMILALRSGDIDMTVTEVPAITAQELEAEGYNVLRNMSLGFEHVVPNIKNEIMGELAVRQALALIVDREQIAQFAFDGNAEVMYGPISPVYAEYQYDDIRHPGKDTAAAKQILLDAGWEEGDDGIMVRDGQRLSLNLMYAVSVTEYAKVSQILAQDAKEAGIELIDTPMDKALTTDIIYNFDNKDWHLYLGTWGILDDIPSTMVTLYHSDAGLNWGLWSNAEADAAMEMMTTTGDETIVQENMRIVQQAMVDDIPDIPILVKRCAYVFNDKFAGQTAYPSNLKGVIDVEAVLDIYLVQ